MQATQRAGARCAETGALEAEGADLGARREARKVVDRAEAVLMAKGMSEADAFKRLQKAAMDKRTTLRAVADAVITAAELDV